MGVFMGKRDWDRVLTSDISPISRRFDDWLKSHDSPTFQLTSEDFRNVGLKPADHIPNYRYDTLPDLFKENGIELLRNQVGGCLLIKQGEYNLPTLFPKLSSNFFEDNIYDGHPFDQLAKISVLDIEDLNNEETGVVLGMATGVFRHFFINSVHPSERFTYIGRINSKVGKKKARVKGKISILDRSHDVNTSVEGDAYFESDERIIVLEAKNTHHKRPFKNFSLHQLILPQLYLRSYTKKPISCVFMNFSHVIKLHRLIFLLYHFEISEKNGVMIPHDYDLISAKKYIIHTDDDIGATITQDKENNVKW